MFPHCFDRLQRPPGELRPCGEEPSQPGSPVPKWHRRTDSPLTQWPHLRPAPHLHGCYIWRMVEETQSRWQQQNSSSLLYNNQIFCCWTFQLTLNISPQLWPRILKKMPLLGTTGATTWCLSGPQWLTLRCLWQPLKISATPTKPNGQVFTLKCLLHSCIALNKSRAWITPPPPFFSRSNFHPDWNHNHGNSRRPCGGCSYFRRHHLCCACQVLPEWGPPASARGSVPAVQWR